MNIHQLSVTYEPDQDRILVQINTLAGEVLRVWLTRRLVINLLPLLTREIIHLEAGSAQLASQDDATQKMLMEFKKQAFIAQGDFKTPFNPTAAVFPIGPEPLLATSVHLTHAGSGALRIGFDEKLVAGGAARGFEAALASDLMHGFMHLLESAIGLSNWGVLLASNPQATLDDAEGKNSPSGPVRYMN